MRPRIPRPRGASYSFACVACRLLLDDGVEYAWCPACGRDVDWIAREHHVWACTRCDTLVAGPETAPACARCATSMPRLASPRAQPAPARPPLAAGVLARRMLAVALVVQAVLALAAPDAFPYLGVWLVVAQVIAIAFVGVAALVSREVRDLARDQRTRILHGLEHATIELLHRRGLEVRSGRTYDGEFVLVFDHDGRTWDRRAEIGDAATDAIRRIAAGEHALAYSVHCGTSLLVGYLLLALAIAGIGVAGLVLGTASSVVFALTVAAAVAARLVSRPLGLLAQRWLTVSTALASASIRAIDERVLASGSRMHVTIAIDVVPRARTGGAVSPTVLG